jgi:anti-sigma factor RsiW
MSSLTCKQFIGFLDDFLAGAQPADVRRDFERHIAACRHCADFLRTYRETIALGKGAFGDEDAALPASVPEDLVKAVLAVTEQSTPDRRA